MFVEVGPDLVSLLEQFLKVIDGVLLQSVKCLPAQRTGRELRSKRALLLDNSSAYGPRASRKVVEGDTDNAPAASGWHALEAGEVGQLQPATIRKRRPSHSAASAYPGSAVTRTMSAPGIGHNGRARYPTSGSEFCSSKPRSLNSSSAAAFRFVLRNR